MIGSKWAVAPPVWRSLWQWAFFLLPCSQGHKAEAHSWENTKQVFLLPGGWGRTGCPVSLEALFFNTPWCRCGTAVPIKNIQISKHGIDLRSYPKWPKQHKWRVNARLLRVVMIPHKRKSFIRNYMCLHLPCLLYLSWESMQCLRKKFDKQNQSKIF